MGTMWHDPPMKNFGIGRLGPALGVWCVFMSMTVRSAQDLTSASVVELMPEAVDLTSMWWRDGFPGVVDGAPWERCVHAGRYGFVMDTEKMQLPHFGAWPKGDKQTDVFALPAADLWLRLTVDGTVYRCTAGGAWTRFTGPRLIESGSFFQRGDVTNLEFTAADGRRLAVDARCEMAAWSDHLAVVLAARPTLLPNVAGEKSFGRVNGGYGLDGSNGFVIPKNPELESEHFTLAFWTFVPRSFKASAHSPWLVCKNAHEAAAGNYGLIVRDGGVLEGRLNTGSGRENLHAVVGSSQHKLRMEAWNHLAMSFDGKTCKIFVNGRTAAVKNIARPRKPTPGPLSFGHRGDNSGDGYRFRGAIDEVRLYDRALSEQELRERYRRPEVSVVGVKPLGEWSFDAEGTDSSKRLSPVWKQAVIEVELKAGGELLRSRWQQPESAAWSAGTWHQCALVIDPVTRKVVSPAGGIDVVATERKSKKMRSVAYDGVLGCYRINLDGIEPEMPAGVRSPSNDGMERVLLKLENTADVAQAVRLMFEKAAHGFRHRIGVPITGVTAMLRDMAGQPIGLPVQLSKNWHNQKEGGVYAGQWFHGMSRLCLPPKSQVELELSMAYGHWGGVAAASHAQLSLVGWGSNQLWDETALGSWGESICFEPDQVQGKSLNYGCAAIDGGFRWAFTQMGVDGQCWWRGYFPLV